MFSVHAHVVVVDRRRPHIIIAVLIPHDRHRNRGQTHTINKYNLPSISLSLSIGSGTAEGRRYRSSEENGTENEQKKKTEKPPRVPGRVMNLLDCKLYHHDTVIQS